MSILLDIVAGSTLLVQWGVPLVITALWVGSTLWMVGMAVRMVRAQTLEQIHAVGDRADSVKGWVIRIDQEIVRWVTIPYLVTLPVYVGLMVMTDGLSPLNRVWDLFWHFVWAAILWRQYKNRPRKKKRLERVLAKIKVQGARLVVVPT